MSSRCKQTTPSLWLNRQTVLFRDDGPASRGTPPMLGGVRSHPGAIVRSCPRPRWAVIGWAVLVGITLTRRQCHTRWHTRLEHDSTTSATSASGYARTGHSRPGAGAGHTRTCGHASAHHRAHGQPGIRPGRGEGKACTARARASRAGRSVRPAREQFEAKLPGTDGVHRARHHRNTEALECQTLKCRSVGALQAAGRRPQRGYSDRKEVNRQWQYRSCPTSARVNTTA